MTHTFLMILDEHATPTLEAVMASGMAARFPVCRFEIKRTRNLEFADMVIPIAHTRATGGAHDEFTMVRPPADLTDDVQETFSDLLREAREARVS